MISDFIPFALTEKLFWRRWCRICEQSEILLFCFGFGSINLSKMIWHNYFRLNTQIGFNSFLIHVCSTHSFSRFTFLSIRFMDQVNKLDPSNTSRKFKNSVIVYYFYSCQKKWEILDTFWRVILLEQKIKFPWCCQLKS